MVRTPNVTYYQCVDYDMGTLLSPAYVVHVCVRVRACVCAAPM